MIKSLLVAYDGSHGARVALQHAVDVARRCEGRVMLITATRRLHPETAALDDGAVDLVSLASRELDTEEGAAPPDGDDLLAEAYDVCRELTVRCLARPAYGELSFALSRASRLADLLFIGRDAASEPGRYAAAGTARRAAAGAVCPVMIAPREYEPVRSALVVCPMTDRGARALHTAAELAGLLQVKLDALIVSENVNVVGQWTHEVRRYLVDHGHTPRVLIRKAPARLHLDGLLADRQSPMVVVPRGSPLSTLLRRDLPADALRALGAAIVVQP
jgi:nucleotide-binding universal stress UspA family protein